MTGADVQTCAATKNASGAARDVVGEDVSWNQDEGAGSGGLPVEECPTEGCQTKTLDLEAVIQVAGEIHRLGGGGDELGVEEDGTVV